MPDPIRTLVLAENMFLAPFLALKIIFMQKSAKCLIFGLRWLWKMKKKIGKKFFFHEKMMFYFIVLNVSKIVSEHYRHPRIPRVVRSSKFWDVFEEFPKIIWKWSECHQKSSLRSKKIIFDHICNIWGI